MSDSNAGKAGRSHQLRSSLLTLLFYCTASVVLTWPLIAQLGTHIPGRIGDGYVHLWTYSWIRDTLLAGESPYQTDLLFFPVGANLLNHNIAWVHIMAWLPLQALIGDDVAYSIIHLLVFPLNGFAVYLLAREHLRSEAAAFTSGLVAGFWPYNLSHFDHPNLILICWIPLAILFLGRMFTNQRWRDALLAGIFIALLGITRWQLLILGGILIALYVLYMLITDARARSRRSVMLLIFAGVVALLIMLPLLYPILDYQINRVDIMDIQISEELPYATDLLAYFVPNRYHPLWGPNISEFSRYFTGNNNYTRTVGYTVLFLVILGLIKRFRQALFWLIAAVAYFFLALGPELFVYGKAMVPLPYKLLESLTIMQLVRFPDRYNVVLSIPVAMLAGYGVLVLVDGLTRRKVLTRTAVISGLILFEYLVTFNMLSLHTPAWYETLAAEPGRFGILDVPMHVQTFDTHYNYYQLTHGKPLVEGHISRPSREMSSFIDSIPFLGEIYYRERPPQEAYNVSESMRLLEAADVRYLILHKYLIGKDDVAAWREWMVVPPVYEDDDIVVFETKVKQVGEELPWKWKLYSDPASGQTVGLVASSLPQEPLLPGYWVEAHTTWASDAPIDTDLDACLHLLTTDGQLISSECAEVSAAYPTSKWQADDLIHAGYVVEIPPFQEEGTVIVGLSLMDDGKQLGDIVEIGEVEIASFPRVFDLPDVTHTTSASWENEITLRGYDAAPTDDVLELTLYWQALRRMNDSYKVFVHVMDVATGQVVAQIDTVPRDWSYPTNWWEEGEIVEDTMILPLVEVPPGRYELSVGIYNPDTNERLKLTAGSSEDQADGFALEIFQR